MLKNIIFDLDGTIALTAGDIIFSLNYALGQQMGNPADFRAAKVHFGIVNSF